MNIDSYLSRIAYAGPRTPDAAALAELQAAHLQRVPFENLDIGLGRPLSLDLADLYAKIVERRRGGFCYELNGLFAALLESLGYRVTRLSARVRRAGGGFGPDFDHLALRVDLDEPWLVDVGFGDSFRRPLQLIPGAVQSDGRGRFRLDREGADWVLFEENDDGWAPGYAFSLAPRALADFAEMCRHHQTSPDSGFTTRRTCSRASGDGRVTLSDGRLLITAPDGARSEEELPDAGAVAVALWQHFGVQLYPHDPALRRAIAGGLTCDITTTGRKSGRPSRIEIWYFVVDGQIVISGTPGPRDWYANLLASPELIFHVKEGAQADLPARAVPILDPAERARIMAAVISANSYFAGGDLDAWVAGSPLVVVLPLAG